MRGRSSDTLGVHRDGSLGLAFVDGDHSVEGTLRDLRLMWPKVHDRGGLLLLHDAVATESKDTEGVIIDNEVRIALKRFCKEEAVKFFDIPGTWGLVAMFKGDTSPWANGNSGLKFF